MIRNLLHSHDFMLFFISIMPFSRLFQLDPSSKAVFHFKGEINYGGPRLIQHAKTFIKTIDRAVGLLGPDIELLTEILLELGKKHGQYGVRPSHYVSAGQSLMNIMEDVLGDRFQPHHKNAWLEVYQGLSYDMIRSSSLSSLS